MTVRSVHDVGPGDYIKVGDEWLQIISNTAFGLERAREWTVEAADGKSYGMYDINLYAKREDIEGKCLYCDFEVPWDTPVQQRTSVEVEHMNSTHPEIIEARMLKAGFRKDGDKWVDTLTGRADA